MFTPSWGFAAKQLPVSLIFSLSFCPSARLSFWFTRCCRLLLIPVSLCLAGAAFQRVCAECYLHHCVCSGHGRVLYANGLHWFTTDGKCDPYHHTCVRLHTLHHGETIKPSRLMNMWKYNWANCLRTSVWCIYISIAISRK